MQHIQASCPLWGIKVVKPMMYCEWGVVVIAFEYIKGRDMDVVIRMGALLWGLGVLFVVSGCEYLNSKDQIELIDDQAAISGVVRVGASVPLGGQLQVSLLEVKEEGLYELVNRYMVPSSGRFKFHASPGRYLVVAFSDENGDQVLQEGEYSSLEHAANRGVPILLAAEQRYDLGELTVQQPFGRPKDIVVGVGRDASERFKTREVTIDDPIFSDENAGLGLWRPIDFLNQIGGGLYSLGPVMENKIPVIFIHGISGHPAQWSQLLSELDRAKYQALMLYYPSGLRIETVSTYLQREFSALASEHGFESVYVVAHSMGGLVARSFVKGMDESEQGSKVDLFITINSPMKGMASANIGIKYAPVVLPVWRDVAAGSELVQELNAWQLPADIPYYMFFSYLDGEPGDGVVPFSSQIPSNLQDEAKAIYGLNAGHTLALKEQSLIRRVYALFDRYYTSTSTSTSTGI